MRPGTLATRPADEPVLFVTRPAADAATRTAVVICPGGGYGHLSMEKEGSRIAEWLNSFGVTACVLRYRHHGTGHVHPTPMLDGQRAIRTVRSRAVGMGSRPGADRRNRFFRRRPFGEHARHPFRRRQLGGRRSDRPRQFPPRLHGPLLPGDFALGRLHPHRLARQSAGHAARPGVGSQSVE